VPLWSHLCPEEKKAAAEKAAAEKAAAEKAKADKAAAETLARCCMWLKHYKYDGVHEFPFLQRI